MNNSEHQAKINNDKFNRRALQVTDAQSLAVSYVKRGAAESLRLQASDGRILAAPVTAPHPYPAFARSGMDGYALRSEDLNICNQGEIVWLHVVDEIPCGYVSSIRIESGTASRIMTGAQVPEGADCVVMLEATEQRVENGVNYVGLKRSIEPGKNITPRGFELQEEALILQEGTRIGPGEISVLATFGVHMVEVYRQPQVGIFSTGSELLDIDEPLEPGKIRNSNTYMLASQIREAGGVPVIMEAIPDDVELARMKVEDALREYDIVVTTGGVSVGDYDIMGELVTSSGLDMLFNKVTMRPGSVTTAAVKDGKLLFALSGNPGACYVGFLLFVRPAIRKMLGMERLFLTEVTAVLGADYNKVNNFTRFVRGSLQAVDGRLVATPAVLDESSVMITIKDSDCLIIIPPELRGAARGQEVQVLVLPGIWS
ncbi:molybdopterin molybdotransferase MoeA [Paenibacillus sp. JCM 10914]|uniref:molybdopterin molybdotransferase MoeA n=1 Tax=Paenibacillus sp. JCM 10914 TaxID=1236974 RepID=UPI0003CC86CA|nr:gephyrin-like molybdotransferase Glp [Paenibacillus sp. JCM 10914]GAE05414.1 molybdopterin biosynthesis protein MoeA [Paenibacillus sp. JCM 10914]